MDIKAFFAELSERGIRVVLDDNGALRVKGKKTQLSHELVESLKANKQAIADFLANEDVENAVAEPEVVASGPLQPSVTTPTSKVEPPQFAEPESISRLEASKSDAFGELTLHGLVEAQVVENPNKIAVEFKDGRLSYAQLNHQANKIALFLRREGIDSDSLVGVCLEPSTRLIVVLLAILKSGGAYVPINADTPTLRQDCRFDLILTSERLAPLLDAGDHRLYDLDEPEVAQAIDCCSAANPPLTQMQNAFSLACVVFGRCVDGQERGVMIEHGNIIRLVHNINYARLDDKAIVAFCSEVTSDASLFEIWGALANGATLIQIDRNLQSSPAMLRQALMLKQISVMYTTMVQISHLVAQRPDCFASLECLLFQAEPLVVGDINRLIDGGKPKRLIHVFGVLENTTFSSFYEIAERRRSYPIGKPLSSSSCYLLGPDGQQVKAGDNGELYVGGFGLARGYLDDWHTSEATFIANPFSDDPNERLLSTRRQARDIEDGNIELLDHNVDKALLAPLPVARAERPSLQATRCGRFVQSGWQSVPLTTVNRVTLIPDGCFIVFADNYGVGDKLAQSLRLASQQVVLVRGGRQFAVSTEFELQIDPGSESDYLKLFEYVADTCAGQSHVVHLWSIEAMETMAACEPVFEQLSRFDNHRVKGLDSVTHLLAAAQTTPFELIGTTLVTRQCCSVTSDERLVPSACQIGAAVDEQQRIWQIDLGLDELPPADEKQTLLAGFIVAELSVETREPQVAYRGRQRWLPSKRYCAWAGQTAVVASNSQILLMVENASDREALLAQLQLCMPGTRVVLAQPEGLPPLEQPISGCDIDLDRPDTLVDSLSRLRREVGLINGIVYCPDVTAKSARKVHTLLKLDEDIRNNPTEFCLIITQNKGVGPVGAARLFTDAFVQNKHNLGNEQWCHLVCNEVVDLAQDKSLTMLLQLEQISCLEFERTKAS